MIKVVCNIAGIIELVQTTKLQGTSKKILTVPKYSLITSHTARRSFVTNMSIIGLTPKEIGLMTGHSQMRIVDIYDKSKAEENAVKVFNRLS